MRRRSRPQASNLETGSTVVEQGTTPGGSITDRLLTEALLHVDSVPLALRAALDYRLRYLGWIADDPARDVPAALAAYRDELHRQVDEACRAASCRWAAA